VMGSHERSNESPGFIKGWELVYQLSGYEFFKDYVPWS
jgi:hypothetical protein